MRTIARTDVKNPRYPLAFHHLDRFCVVGVDTGTPIESHFNESKALHAAQVLNDHNERTRHADRYEVAAIV